MTLCFSTAICGNLANFIQNQGDPLYKYTPEFERVTSAASAIFGYAFIFPFFISGKFTRFLDRIPTEHIDGFSSEFISLQKLSICSIRILTSLKVID